MKKHIIYFRGTFNGLYGWGKGWNMDAYYKWQEFWRDRRDIFWHYVKNGDSEYLVTTSGSVYLHPMDFGGGLFDCGCTYNGKYFDSEIAELYEICKECAIYCGGSFSLMVSDEIETNVGNLKEYFGK